MAPRAVSRCSQGMAASKTQSYLEDPGFKQFLQYYDVTLIFKNGHFYNRIPESSAFPSCEYFTFISLF